MPGRSFSSNSYRFGFNGKEKDDEIKGTGNSYDFGARMYDSRIGRWLAVDPLASKQPGWSPYKAFLDNPIIYNDPDGNTEYLTIHVVDGKTGGKLGEIIVVQSNLVFWAGSRTVSHIMGDYQETVWKHQYNEATITLNEDNTISMSSVVSKHGEEAITTIFNNTQLWASLIATTSELWDKKVEENKAESEKLNEIIRKKYGSDFVYKNVDPGKEGDDRADLIFSFFNNIADVVIGTGKPVGKVDESQLRRGDTAVQRMQGNMGSTYDQVFELDSGGIKHNIDADKLPKNKTKKDYPYVN